MNSFQNKYPGQRGPKADCVPLRNVKVNFATIVLKSCGFWDNHTHMLKMLFLLLFLRSRRYVSMKDVVTV